LQFPFESGTVRRHHFVETPSRWLVDNAPLLPREAPDGGVPRALDVACGSGRHALWLAAAGFDVHAMDRDAGAIGELDREARRLGLAVTARVDDLERDGVSLGREQYDAIVVVRYLYRPLFPVLRGALRPSGVLVYETFTVDQAARGKPSNPAFLLKHGELVKLVAPLRVLRQREGDFEGGMVAGVIARKDRPVTAST
jgi:tellurite methyltransferase